MPITLLSGVLCLGVLSLGLLIGVAALGANECGKTACIRVVDRSLLDYVLTGEEISNGSSFLRDRPGMTWDERYPQHYR